MSANIIKSFGGARSMAKFLHLPATTVQYWHEQGYIPPRQQPGVMRAAKKHGITIDLADFAFSGPVGGPAE